MTKRIFISQLNNNVLTSLNSMSNAPQIGGVCAYSLAYIKQLERVIEENISPSYLANLRIRAAEASAVLFNIKVVATDNPCDAFALSEEPPQEELKEEVTNEENDEIESGVSSQE